MLPSERYDVAREIAKQWLRQVNKLHLKGEDLASILPAAAGLVVGRSHLDPVAAAAVVAAAIAEGVRERQMN